MNNKKYLFIGTTAILIGCFLLGIKYFNSAKEEELSFLAQENSEVFIRDHSPRFGNPNAKVFLVEFLDPECESCRAFYPHVKKIIKEHDGKVQLAIRYAPFHGNSKTVIRALEASKLQNKYWESIETLFKYLPNWGSHHNPQVELIYGYLDNIGVDTVKLKEDMKNPAYNEIIRQDMEDLKTLGVRGTPHFFVNGRPLTTFSLDGLKGLIQEEVDKAYN